MYAPLVRRCSACNVEVDDSAPRCPRCLRVSTLSAPSSSSSSSSSNSTGARSSLRALPIAAAVLALLLLRVGAYVPIALTDWLSVGDLCVTLVVAGAAAWLFPRMLAEGPEIVKPRNPIALAIAGVVFSALALTIAAFAVEQAVDPLALSGSPRRPELHNWTWALLALAIGGAIGWLSSLFWRKLARRY